MKHILLSIKPKWAREILAGTKKWEFRKRFCDAEKGTRIILYSTAPEKKIVGEFILDDLMKEHPNELVNITLHETPHTLEELSDYFGKAPTGVALKIGNKIKYKNPVTLDELRKFMKQPPMSSLILDENNDLHRKLLALIKERR